MSYSTPWSEPTKKGWTLAPRECETMMTPVGRQVILALAVLNTAFAGMLLDDWGPYTFGIISAFAAGAMTPLVFMLDVRPPPKV